MGTIRIAGMYIDSIVDGPGLRFSLYTQGCPHHCEGCHNPHTHDEAGGSDADIDELCEKIKEDPLLDGVTISGGEPFLQAEKLIPFASWVHDRGLNIITYTGYTYEEIIEGQDTHPGWRELLTFSDYLVDGRFIKEQKSYLLRFKGSKNQRIIDTKQSLKSGAAVEVEL